MPELPDILTYIYAIENRLMHKRLLQMNVISPFVLRTVEPKPADYAGRHLFDVRRMGKRIVFDFGDEYFAVVHLMIAGRFHWKEPGAKTGGKINLAQFEFENGSLMLTEASSKKRASLTLIYGESNVANLHIPAVEPLVDDAEHFIKALRKENHTLKRSLTDPHLFSGIGNAYSDEILHAARLSPMKLTSRLTDEEAMRLYEATKTTLLTWITRLKKEVGTGFPEKVTAFRPEMAVHGKFGQKCPVCCCTIQRIAYAENECNYCVNCQTEGKLLADRSLSRLMKGDWPKSLAELEERKARHSS